MAKKAEINLQINTGNSIKTLNDLAFSFEEVYGEVRPLTTQIGELEDVLYEMTRAGQAGTEAFRAIQAEIAKSKKVIIDTDLAIDAMSQSLGGKIGLAAQGFAGAFAGIQGAMALAGVESENVEKALLKVQSAMAITEGIKSIRETIPLFKDVYNRITQAALASSLFNKATREQAIATGTATSAQKVLNTVMKANPIFLVIGAVGALVGAFALFSSKSEDVAKKEEERARATKAAAEASKKENEEVSKSSAGFVSLIFQLKNTNAKSKERKELIGEINKTYGATLKNLSDETLFQQQLNKAVTDFISFKKAEYKIRANDELIQKNLEKQAKIEKELNKALKDKNEIMQNRKDAGLAFDPQAAGLENEAIAKLTKELDEANKRLMSYGFNIGSAKEEMKDLGFKTDETTKSIDNNNKVVDEAINFSKKLAEEKKKLTDEELARVSTQEQIALKTKQTQEQELKDIYDKSKKTELDKQNLNAALLVLENVYQASLKKIKKEEDIKTANTEVIKAENEVNKIRLAMKKANLLEFVVLAEKLKTKELALLNEQMEAELLAVEDNEEQKEKIRIDYALKRTDLEKEQTERYKSTTEEQKEALRGFAAYNELVSKDAAAGWEAFQEEWKDDWVGTLSTMLDGVANTIAQISDLFQQAFDEQNARAEYKINQRYEASSEALKAQLADRLISEETYKNQSILLEQQKAQEELALKRKAFQQSKRIQILNATIQGAQAVLAGYSSGMAYPLVGPATGAIFAGIAAAMTAAQVGIISSQQFRAARGGVVPGSGPSTIDSVPSLLAPGEMVINANSAGMFPELLSNINQAGGGISLAPSTSSLSQTTSTTQSSQPQVIKAFVVESEITDTQKRVSRLERASQFG